MYINTEEEVWKDIKGYEGLYKISTLGRIKKMEGKVHYKDGRVRRYREQLRKVRIGKAGYPAVTLTKNKKKKTHTIHSLLAEAFIPKVDGKDRINHINGIKSDNSLENLEWCTQKENMTHARDTGLLTTYGENTHSSKLTEADVLEIRDLFENKKYSHQKIADIFNVSRENVGSIVRRQTWTHI